MELKDRVLASVIGFLFILISLSPGTAKAQYDDVSLETFYEELSPYGVWIQDPEYGTVWRPDVDQDDFRPYYTNGRWQMTKYGNTWVSDYEWGWAPFHYGRWHHSGRRGWVWIPDVHWGPAWVSWRSGGGHYGWAPLGPGINVNISIGRIPDFWWVFIPQRSIYYDRYPRYDYRRYRTIYHNTVIINNTYVYNTNRYYTGPRADDIRRVTRQPVRIHEVRDNRPSYAGRTNNPRPERSSVSSGDRGSVNGNSSGISSRDRTGAVSSSTNRPSTVANGRSSTDRSPSSGSVSSSTNRPSPVSSGRDASGVSRTDRSSTSGTVSSPSSRPSTVGSGRSERSSGTGSTSPTIRQAPPQSSPSRSSSTVQRNERPAERTQTSRPTAPAPAPRQSTPPPSRTSSSSPQRQSPPPSSSRQETRPAPSSGRSNSGSSSAPSSRSSERSSSSRPSRGN